MNTRSTSFSTAHSVDVFLPPESAIFGWHKSRRVNRSPDLALSAQEKAGEFQWVSGYRVRGHSMEAEIDLIAMTPDGLLLIECKDTLPKMSALEGQLARVQVIAERLGGCG